MTIPEFPCHDCSVNTVPLERPREYYEVYDSLWQDQAEAPGVGQADNGVQGFYLCIGCLEERVGRELDRGDFKRFPANKPSAWLSDRLNNRLGWAGDTQFVQLAPRETVFQYFPGDLWPAVMERYKPHSFGVHRGTGAYALGGNCEWPEDKKLGGARPAEDRTQAP
jgi:hypothetical protein